MRDFGHVSYERVLSGPGLFNIYRFLRDTGRADEPRWLAEEIRESDPPQVITRHGLSGASELCAESLDRFVSIYGAEAGNLALRLMATGGVFLGGGIAPKILLKLEEERFMNAFIDKGRMRDLLERIPVRAPIRLRYRGHEYPPRLFRGGRRKARDGIDQGLSQPKLREPRRDRR